MSLIQPPLFSLDDYGDKRPLPLIVADRWHFPLQSHESSGDKVYSLHDWARGMLGGKPGTIREQVRRLLNDSTVMLNVTVEKYRAPNGKTYNGPFVDAESLYRATQALRPTNARERLSEVHGAILTYLAKAGVFADKARRDPALVAARLNGVETRSYFAAALAQTVVDMSPYGYATATNTEYKGLFGRDAKQLRRDLETDQIRDKMSREALHMVGLCESLCARLIGERQQLTLDEALVVIAEIAGMLGLQVDEIERRMGIDFVTGRKLTSAIDAIRGA